MTNRSQHLPVRRRQLAAAAQPSTRALIVRPVLALLASRALPAITASVAAAATVLTAERAVRSVTQKLTSTSARPAAPIPVTRYNSTRTVVTEWLTIERRKRAS